MVRKSAATKAGAKAAAAAKAPLPAGRVQAPPAVCRSDTAGGSAQTGMYHTPALPPPTSVCRSDTDVGGIQGLVLTGLPPPPPPPPPPLVCRSDTSDGWLMVEGKGKGKGGDPCAREEEKMEADLLKDKYHLTPGKAKTIVYDDVGEPVHPHYRCDGVLRVCTYIDTWKRLECVWSEEDNEWERSCWMCVKEREGLASEAEARHWIISHAPCFERKNNV